ncbi:hypothetical protein [Amycolatopsis panacis]|uniref:Uncharacterized protein n=1 Tax=Amycolatopsis panacis TaxID=2340917 RepID=A0A419IAB9_9PSEU|nr:hypothetical protein [Amycolatopsis panacis]RJQ90279.1 hypothetical protein D5S19_03205 [Amycolatopsis panacis]
MLRISTTVLRAATNSSNVTAVPSPGFHSMPSCSYTGVLEPAESGGGLVKAGWPSWSSRDSCRELTLVWCFTQQGWH